MSYHVFSFQSSPTLSSQSLPQIDFTKLLPIAEDLITNPNYHNLNPFFLFSTSVHRLYKCKLPCHPHETARLISYWWHSTIPFNIKSQFHLLVYSAKEGNVSTSTVEKRLSESQPFQMGKQYIFVTDPTVNLAVKKQKEDEDNRMFSHYTFL
ncbi:9611_t:CDS:1 [Paraglomus brasilianum]|uniref:9611_t:CDS:1 n=1 Tax=Paraglomus brasilianum TaxID=144538 RepID=A0A9N8VIV0_9GLOM|nr:9611_t:CDS:1 [Paraglomus brasilianum]